MYLEGLAALVFLNICASTRIPLEVFQRHPSEHRHHHRISPFVESSIERKKLQEHAVIKKVLYQIGSSEEDLPECNPRSICNKVDLYHTPWVERQCRCPEGRICPMGLDTDDGHTFVEKTRQYKLCESIKKLPKCRFFRDTTWSITLYANNVTEQVLHCHCPKNSVTYLNKVLQSKSQIAFQYLFSCSPETRLRCQRKEPCRLFTVRRRQESLDEANVDTLCQCPHGHRCPRHHTDEGVILVKSYGEKKYFDDDFLDTYSGYCLPS
ncbi:protein giant-lens [Cylas formicarius]|uniref:protein giant-lens n=1 Tax=Cylas formicarius TaxID=197179 RepID=UPI002958B44B|nr:protein giant-lens [Cylas formicarius]